MCVEAPVMSTTESEFSSSVEIALAVSSHLHRMSFEHSDRRISNNVCQHEKGVLRIYNFVRVPVGHRGHGLKLLVLLLER
jgi:hypothetical protein